MRDGWGESRTLLVAVVMHQLGRRGVAAVGGGAVELFQYRSRLFFPDHRE